MLFWGSLIISRSRRSISLKLCAMLYGLIDILTCMCTDQIGVQCKYAITALDGNLLGPLPGNQCWSSHTVSLLGSKIRLFTSDSSIYKALKQKLIIVLQMFSKPHFVSSFAKKKKRKVWTAVGALYLHFWSLKWR